MDSIMLKKYLYSAIYICSITLFSCAGSSTAYQMDATEKEKQRGYHANEANKIIDKNIYMINRTRQHKHKIDTE